MQPRKLYIAAYMREQNKIESPSLVFVCVICFQRQPCGLIFINLENKWANVPTHTPTFYILTVVRFLNLWIAYEAIWLISNLNPFYLVKILTGRKKNYMTKNIHH